MASPEDQAIEDALEGETLAGSLRGSLPESQFLGDLSATSPNRFASELLTALGHPTRLRIVALLRRRDMAVGQISQSLGISQANASQHLAVLLRAGALVRTSDGTTRRYSLRGDKIGTILDLVEEFRHAHLAEETADIAG